MRAIPGGSGRKEVDGAEAGRRRHDVALRPRRQLLAGILHLYRVRNLDVLAAQDIPDVRPDLIERLDSNRVVLNPEPYPVEQRRAGEVV